MIHSDLDFIRDEMRDFPKPWFIAGGWAVDLALGRVTRAHEDIDICVYREDAGEVLRYFDGWAIKVAIPGEHRLVDCEQVNDLLLPRYCLHLFRENNFIEIMLTERKGENVLFRKNKEITMSVTDFERYDREGRPFVNPVWQLLFKSLSPRDKDNDDFTNYFPDMNHQEKQWLTEGLRLMNPDSEWLQRLSV
ncbi:hypothetical protein FHS18_003398 [Paenibacillus phyllosphaerae]|uniref:Aminoglycoside-2''-adenylyltransferase n=1 Tax=Paenibacillus phyllosphaerae TaxID=274593 RepID=A0A7W5AYW0_9BACL|nr:hypothetical protein [Paenibacillus phyllosphaerae]MBB3111330.1 hypothetical protein [Paenibacillus phyllosphaerae]